MSAGAQNQMSSDNTVPSRPYPFSFSQKITLAGIQSGHVKVDIRNLTAAYRIRGALNVPAIVRGLHSVFGRHEILRSRITVSPDLDDCSSCVADLELPLRIVDLTDIDPLEREKQAENAVSETLWSAFDSDTRQTGAMFRAIIVKLAADDHIIGTVLDHMIADAPSTGVIWRELETFCSNHKTNAEGLPGPSAQYWDFISDKIEWERAKPDADTAFWQKHALPPAIGKGALHSLSSSFATQFSAEEKAALRQFAKQERVTLGMLLMTIYVIASTRYTTDAKIAVPIVLNERLRKECYFDLVGQFAATAAVVIDLSGNPTVRALLKQVRATMSELITHAWVPIDLQNSARALLGSADAMLLDFIEVRVPKLEALQVSAYDLPPPEASDLASHLFFFNTPDALHIKGTAVDAQRSGHLATDIKAAGKEMIKDPNLRLHDLLKVAGIPASLGR